MPSLVTAARVERFKQSRFNPIRSITPDKLSRQLDDYQAGVFSQVALTFDAIEKRDDVLKCVIPKRKSAVARHTYEIVTVKGADEAEAEKHKEALEYFYANLKCTSAIDGNIRGGYRKLFKSMMDAEAKGYSAFEILWRPTADGMLTATFNHVPLNFFENRTGKLRFLQNDSDYDGIPLDEGNWMIATGEGLMEACAVAYMFKRVGAQDWLTYCERHGMPAIHGQTDAAPNTEEHDALKDIVSKMAADFSCVTSKNDLINIIQTSAQGTLPYPILVERMDRALAALWRGADLSTISAGNGAGQGASLQGEESHTMEEDDGLNISETLQQWVDPRVIEWYFGPGVEPLAYFKVVVPPRLNVDEEIKKDNHLISHGVPINISDALERYQRPTADESQPLMEAPVPPAPAATPFGRNSFAANESARQLHGDGKKLIQSSLDQMARAQAHDWEPIFDRLDAVFRFEGEAFLIALRKFANEFPDMLHKLNLDPETAKVLQGTLTAGVLNGMAEGYVDRSKIIS